MENNPDIKYSNMLDLHGLHVKEAIDALKQTMYKKRAGIAVFNKKTLF